VLGQGVVLVTDHPSRSAVHAEALRSLTPCTVAGPEVEWSAHAGVAAVVADLDLNRTAAMQCLLALRRQPWAGALPVLCLMVRGSDRALRQAHLLGAAACLPFYTEPHVVVTAVLNLVDPDQGGLNATIRRCAARAAGALGDLFHAAAQAGRLDLAAVDRSVDPLLESLREGGLARWLNTLRAHDDVTYRHCLVVAGLAAQFTAHVRFPLAQQRRLVRAALVHDVGKARIPRSLLLKRGALDATETAVMRSHVELGHAILRASPDADAAMLDAARHHHERLDGSGYPDGLSGEAISDVARFIAICDVYAALTERRPFRPAMTPGEAMATLAGMERQLEPGFVQAFGRAILGSV
jgi:putative nucleotidyltransferase with HDIG domain